MVGRSFTFSAGGGRPWPGIWLGDRGNRRDRHSPARTGGSTRGQSHSKLPTGLNAAGERLLADCLRLEVRSLRPLSVLGFSTAAVLVDTRRRRRSGLFEDKKRRCTDVLLSLNVAAFAAQLLSQGALLAWGAKVNPLIASGQVWRLLTPALLHGGLMHLFVNCYSLNDLGPAAERLLGPRKFTALYIASAISGNVASFYFSPAPGVGASGAIFGLVGCLAVYFARHRHLYGRMGELKLEALMRVIVMNLGLGAMSRTIDNWAHVGGLVGGAALTFTCGPNLVWEGGRLVDRPLVRLQL